MVPCDNASSLKNGLSSGALSIGQHRRPVGAVLLTDRSLAGSDSALDIVDGGRSSGSRGMQRMNVAPHKGSANVAAQFDEVQFQRTLYLMGGKF
jgi:hypothetical protein